VGILQHIGDDEETDHTSSDIDLIKLRATTTPSSHGDIFQGDVEVILRCKKISARTIRPTKIGYLQRAFRDKAAPS
jgi:hypothetical protein